MSRHIAAVAPNICSSALKDITVSYQTYYFLIAFLMISTLQASVVALCGPGNSGNVTIIHKGLEDRPTFISSQNTYYFKFTATTRSNTIRFSGDTEAIVLVVAGGGGGAVRHGGGGGAGGLIYSSYRFKGTDPFSIVVGAGGIGRVSTSPGSGGDGNSSWITNSSGGILFLARGGSGGTYAVTPNQGGSCGGCGPGVTMSQPLFTNIIASINGSSAGYSGGLGSNLRIVGCSTTNSACYAGGGGGGRGSAGYPAIPFINATLTPAKGGNGGNGTVVNITGENVVYAAGGGGGCSYFEGAAPGLGGGAVVKESFVRVGGNGSFSNNNAGSGSPNTGSGGGGAGFGLGPFSFNGNSGFGADGVIIIAWQYCSVCLPGKYENKSISSSSSAVCVDCQAGTFSSEGSVSRCYACAAGKYSPTSGISIFSQRARLITVLLVQFLLHISAKHISCFLQFCKAFILFLQLECCRSIGVLHV